ncbi:MAG TPA: WHG domain-containing protein [Gaiellaceae bacterium]|nr:WHG domain-containing protein [Gaiellaceae bacterium]
MVRAGIDPATVVAAAAELADAEGLEAVTLTRLADALGVRPPSLYAHIDGLADVRRRLGARGNTELAAALSHAVEGRSGRDALRALAVAYRDYARAHPGSYAALQRSRDLADDDEARAAGEAVVRVALAVLRSYPVEGDDAIHAVRLIRVTLHGFVSIEAVGGFAMNVSADETFERLVALLDSGLKGTA